MLCEYVSKLKQDLDYGWEEIEILSYKYFSQTRSIPI